MLITRNSSSFDRFIHIVCESDGSPSGGGAVLPPDAQRSFDSRLAKLEGNSIGLAQQLYSENYSLREKVRLLEPRVVPEGATVLTGDDAKSWEAYKLLGKPEEVKQGLDERNQFQGELEGHKRETLLRRVADASGFKFNILADREKAARADGKPLAFELREVEVDGVKRQVAYVKDGDEAKPATDYAREHWADYLSVLMVAQGGDQQPTQPGVGNPMGATPNGTRMIGQTAASGGNRGPTDYVAKFLADQAEAAKSIQNPFLPQK